MTMSYLRRPVRSLRAGRVRAVLPVTALAILGAVALAGPADAHVTVGADDAHAGASDAVLTFRVPDESDTAATVKIAISFPTVTPLASVKPAPKPGWKVSTTTSKFAKPITTDDGTISEGVSQVVYTADSAATGIPTGGFDTFQVLVGPIPEKAASLSFPTVQTYSDGKVSSWIAPVTDPANEPDNPAPTLTLLAAGADGAAAPAHGPTPGSSPSSSASSPAGAASSPAGGSEGATTSGSDDSARRLAGAGLGVGVLALLVGAAGLVLGRRRTAGGDQG